MAQVVQPGVVQGMDPAQLWQAQQALNLQRQSLMQNMAQNQINQSQVRNQKKAQEFTAYDKVLQGLVDASNGDMILAMGINPGLFKYGFMKFSGMNADQAEIAVENIRQAGIQNPDVIQKLRFKDVLLDPNLPAYLRQSETKADDGVTAQDVSLKGTAKASAKVPSQPTFTEIPKPEAPVQTVTTPNYRADLMRAASSTEEFIHQRAPLNKSPLLVEDDLTGGKAVPGDTGAENLSTERYTQFTQALLKSKGVQTFLDKYGARDRGMVQDALIAYTYKNATDEELKQIFSSSEYGPDVLPKVRAWAEAQWKSLGAKAGPNVLTDIEKNFGAAPTSIKVRSNREVDKAGDAKIYVPERGLGPRTEAPSNTALAQTETASDAGDQATAAAVANAPQLGEYKPQESNPSWSQEQTTAPEPYGATKIAQSLGETLGLGANATPDIEAGLIAARNVPGVRAFEAVATSNPDKAKASPMAPRIGEALRQAGQKVRASMATALQSLRGEVPFNEPVRKAWRDSQLQIENTKAEDFLGQYKIASDQMLERMDRIYRNPKGAEASYQDFVAHALGGGEGYLNKKNMDNAVDSLIAQVNQWSAQNALATRELDLKDKWAMAELAAGAMKSASSSTPPGMDPELWKMINKQVETMMKNSTDKSGRVSNNGLIEQLQVGNNQQIWDMYNIGVYRLFGGQGSISSKGYQAWAGPLGLGNVARSVLAWVFPGGRAAQTKFLQEFGNVTTFNPSVDVTQNEQGYDASKDTQYQQLLTDLSRTFGLK